MSNEMMSEIKRDHILRLLEKGTRQDGRGVKDFRNIEVETGLIESADGSARVRLGNTTVIAGIKIIPGTPFGDTPNLGVLTTGMELIPMAHPTFESGPPGEDAIDHDGNLFDAANLAAVCALKSAIIPCEQYGKGENKPLPVTCTPISVTEAKVGNTLIVDPDYDEEQISTARLTVTTDDDGNFRAMQKGGCGSITLDELSQCLDRAVEIGAEIRKIIG